MFNVSFTYNTAKFANVKDVFRRAPEQIKQSIERHWNVALEAFKRLMQNEHLEGGTIADRLARRSSNLYNSLVYEVKTGVIKIEGNVWFLPAVKNYAPTHEFGDESRNIPARMNLINEWDAYEHTLIKATEQGMEEGLQNA